jgi:hypothetical protein
MGSHEAVIQLSAEEREELTWWSKSRTLPSGDVFKASLILALADGKSYSAVEAELNTSRPTIARWRARFEAQSDRFGASADFEKDAAAAARRQHALVVPQDGDVGRREPSDRSPDLGEGAVEAPSTGSVHGQQRSGVRGKGS